jgi:hypothetical protein
MHLLKQRGIGQFHTAFPMASQEKHRQVKLPIKVFTAPNINNSHSVNSTNLNSNSLLSIVKTAHNNKRLHNINNNILTLCQA